MSILLTLVAAVSAVSCRTNNGDIGLYYGVWGMTSMSIDGVEDQTVNADGMMTSWSFQNNVIEIRLIKPHNDYTSLFGTWEEVDGELQLNFTHHDDKFAAGQGQYAAPTWLLMDNNAVEHLEIVSQTNSSMVLKYVNNDGKTIEYTLKKEY